MSFGFTGHMSSVAPLAFARDIRTRLLEGDHEGRDIQPSPWKLAGNAFVRQADSMREFQTSGPVAYIVGSWVLGSLVYAICIYTHTSMHLCIYVSIYIYSYLFI